MDIPNGVSSALLDKLHAILVDRPLLMEVLKLNLPNDINLQTLLEVLESINGRGVSDVEIREFLAHPSKSWKDSIYKNQSASIDVSVANYRATETQLGELFAIKAKTEDMKILDDLMEFSK